MSVLASIRGTCFPSHLLVGLGSNFPSPSLVLWVNQPMKEMVSWRGVAKKRRKQERPMRLTKCSLTVAATQQSWPWGNLYLGLIGSRRALLRLEGLDFESPSARPVTTSARLSGKLLGGFVSHHGAPTDLPTRVAENRKAQFESHPCSI